MAGVLLASANEEPMWLVARRIHRRLGVPVHVANTGGEALAILARGEHDVAVIDTQLLPPETLLALPLDTILVGDPPPPGSPPFTHVELCGAIYDILPRLVAARLAVPPRRHV